LAPVIVAAIRDGRLPKGTEADLFDRKAGERAGSS
jgi:hypothetical protein